MSHSKLLLKNITSLGLVQIVNYIFPLLTIPFVSRILGPSGLGSINYITAFVAYFTLIVGYGFDLTATRRIAGRGYSLKNRRIVFSLVFVARLVLFLFSSIIFILCLIYVEKLNENLLLCSIIYINALSVLIAPQFLYQGLQSLTIYSYVNIFRGILSTILIFLLIKKPEDYIIYAAIGVFLNFLTSLFFLVYAWFKFDLKFIFFGFKPSIDLIFRERYIFFSSVIFSLYTSTNIVILGFYESPEKIGYYTVALGLINIIQSVVNIPLSTSLYPFLGNSFSKSIEIGILQLRRIIPIVFYVTFIGGIVLLLSSPFVVKIIYGNKFENAIPCVMILSFLPMISSIASLLGVQTMLNLKMDRDFVNITFYAAILSILLNFLLGYFFSYIGTAISYLITELFIIIQLFQKLNSKNLHIVKLEYFTFKSISASLKMIRK